MSCSSSFQSQGFNLWRLILSDSGVLTAATQLFLLNSIARRQRTAPSWAAAGERLFTTRASISNSYTGGGLIPRTVALSVRRACIGSATGVGSRDLQGPTADRHRTARIDPADQHRKSALGGATHPRRTAQARV